MEKTKERKKAVAKKQPAAQPAAQPSGTRASGRVLRSQQEILRVIHSLCPGGTMNEAIAARLVADNAVLARQPTGEPLAPPSEPTEAPRHSGEPQRRRCPKCEDNQAGAASTDKALIDKALIDREPPTAWRRMRSYVNAKFGGPASYAVVAQRRRTCVNCSSVEQVDDGLFCAACGCGHRRDANLEVKTRMRRAECPLGYWPPSTATVFERASMYL